MRCALLPALLLPLTLCAQWQQVPTPATGTLFSIDSFDEQHLAIGSTGTWLRSTDGGDTWQELPILDPNGQALSLVVFDAMDHRSVTELLATGLSSFGTNPYEVRRSTNGGTNWSTAYTAPGNGTFSRLHGLASSGANVVAVGAQGRIIRSTDGGVTWQPISTSGTTLHDVAWAGTAVVAVGDGRILRSTNNGQAWSQVWSGSPSLQAVSFPTATTGFALGNAGQLYRSDNGGTSWAVVNTQLPDQFSPFTDCWFTSATEGYALAGERLLHTTTGGVYWELFLCAQPMKKLHFTAGGTGFAVGEEGTLYRTGGSGAYQPFALFDPPAGTICPNTPVNFVNQSGPGLSSQWSVNGVVVGTGIDLTWTFTQPGQQDTVTLVVSNGSASDTVQQVVTVGASLVIVNNASVLATTVCSGTATTVQVATSQSGTSYRLWRGTTPQGAAQNGNGGTLNFPTGAIAAPQEFHLIATRTVSGCGTAVDTASFLVGIGNPDATLAVGPATATVCAGATIGITVAGSQTGVNYQLRRNGTNLGAPLAGTGGTLTFTVGPLTAGGTYTVVATNSALGCTSTLTASAVVNVETVYVNWGPTTLFPQPGVPVDLMNGSATQGGVYQWTITGGTPATSTDAEVSGVVFPQPGTYPVRLIGTTPAGCSDTLTRVLQVIPDPEAAPCALAQMNLNGGNPFQANLTMDADDNILGWVMASNSSDLLLTSGGADTLLMDLTVNIPDDQGSLLMKFDPLGIVQWVVRVYHPSSTSFSYADLVTDAEGNVYLAAHIAPNGPLVVEDASGVRTTVSQNAVLVASFTPQGRLRWATGMSEGTPEGTSIALQGDDQLVVQVTARLAQFDRNTGAPGFVHVQNLTFRGLVVADDEHVWAAERFNMVLREYDADGTLLLSTPPITPTPPPGGVAQVFTAMTERDASGHIYQVFTIRGQLIFGTDTITGGSGDERTYFLAKRSPDGTVLWTRTLRKQELMLMQGLVINDERVFLSAHFYGDSLLYMQGLPPQAFNDRDTWLLSYDVDGGSPQATRLYDHGALPTNYAHVTGANALALSADGQRMALWISHLAPLVAGTDTAFAYTDWEDPELPGAKHQGLLFGEVDCISPAGTEPPQAFFTPPTGYCAGQSIPFSDASFLFPTAWSWSFPGGTPATSTAPDPVVSYAAPGTYAVTLIATNANGESVPYTAEVVVDICAGVPTTIADGAWRAWPVPAHDLLQVRGPRMAPARLLDLQGRLVWSGTLAPSGTIDMQGLTPGSYVLLVDGARLRVVKE